MRKILTYTAIVVLFALLCGMGVTAVKETARANEMSLKYENSLKSALTNAVEDMRSLEGDLSKLMITSSLQRDMLSAIAIKSSGCASALSTLPVISTSAQNVLKFSNQLSSYCSSVLKKSELPENFDEQIYSFFNTCRNVNVQLAQLENQVASGSLSLTEIGGEEQESDGVFGSITEDITEYPAVIFDGPFSDGQERTTPKSERSEISKEEASKFIEQLGFNCEFSGEINGVIPCYCFTGENIQAQVTKKGGLLLTMISNREINEAQISLEDGETAAKEFAEKLIYGETEVVWRENYGDTAVYNFVPKINGAVIYPDMFKVKVALDNGDIISFEGKSYIMCNRERNISEPTITADKAKEKLKDGFSAENERLCVISVGQEEYSAWEYIGIYKDMRYAVYFSADDGRELCTFRIISTDGGEAAV